MQNLFLAILFLLLSTILNASATEQVSIQLKWKHSFQFAGYYAAIEKGFYKDEGLDVTLKEIDLSRDFIKDVAIGKSEYGVSDSSLVVYHLQKTPVVLVSQIFQHSPLVFISHRDSNITTPYEMIGKKLMYSIHASGDTPFKALILKTIGDFNKVEISNFTSYQDFIDKKIDVASAYSTAQPYWLKKQGIDVNIIDPKSYGINFYGDNFFTSEKEFEEHPDRVEKMKKATLKGWEYALSHQDEIIDLIIKKYAPKKERDALEFEARGTYQMIMPDLADLGSFSKDKYTQVAKTYHQLGIVENKKIKDDFFYTNRHNSAGLSKEEKKWLEDNPMIKIAVMDYWENDSYGNNIHTDLIRLLNKHGDLNIVPVKFDAWREGFNEAVSGKHIHAIVNASKSKEREKKFLFTKAYAFKPHHLIVRDDNDDIKSLEDLKNKTIYLKEKIIAHDLIKELSDDIKVINIKTDEEIYQKLSKKSDVVATVSYSIDRKKLTDYNLKIANRAYDKYGKIHLAVSQEHPLLQSVINKTYKLIPKDALTTLQNRVYKTVKGKTVNLTQSEKEWLDKNPNVTFAGDPNWLPFEAFDKKGDYQGIVADYLQKIETLLPLNFQPKQTETWSETLALAKKGEVDVISDTIDSEGMRENYTPISPYLNTPLVIVMHSSQDFVNDLSDISDKKIAMIKEYGYNANIKKKYPTQRFIYLENADIALEQLSMGKIDAAVLSMPKAGYLIRSIGYHNLKIVGKTSVDMHLTLFVLKSKPVLHTILEKAMSSLSTSEHTSIIKEWQNVEFAKKTDYTLLYQIAGLLGFFLSGTLYWNRKLSKEVIKRKEVETQIQTLIDNIPVQVLVTSYNGKLLMVNPQTLKDHGLTKEDIQKYNMSEFYAEPKEHEEVLNELQTKGRVDKKIIQFKHLDQSIYSMMVSILPITYEKQNALLSIAVDLSERLKMEKALSSAKEEAEHANLAKSEFLANMSHEIRTPMNSVMGFSELLAKQVTDPVQKDYLDSIQRGGNTLLNIINDILDLSKIEAGKLEMVQESVDLKQLALEMESIFSVKLIQKNIHFELDIDPTLPKYLLLDNTRIRQILFNLIGNAIKFTPHGFVKLSIKKILEDKEKSKIDLQISIEDSGIGVDEENIEHIFDAFEQQKGQDSQKYGGTGLGLAISKKLSTMMNGTISVKSEVGKGSTFTINLSDIPISSVEAVSTQKRSSQDTIEFKKATILIVDDIKDNRKLVASTLGKYSLDSIEAENGKEAIELLRNIKIDLIFMDIKMPVMDGYTATKIIKEDEKLKEIPLIALTASVMGRDLEKIKEYHFDGYLRKPVSQEDLVAQMEKFLKHDRLELLDAQEDEIDTHAYTNLPQVLQALETKHAATWKKIKDMGDFSLISDFSQSLENLGSQNGINILSQYAKELQTNCDSFDIDKIDFMMNSYPSLIEKLRGLKNE